MRVIQALGIVLLFAVAGLRSDQLVPPDTVSVWLLSHRLAQAEQWHPASTVNGSVDWAQVTTNPAGGYILQVQGWGASCQAGSGGIPQGIDVSVDPDAATPNAARWYSDLTFPSGGYTAPAFVIPRQDVQNWAAAVGWTNCVSATPGFWLWIDATTITPGYHTVWMYYWDTALGTRRTIGSQPFYR